VRGSHRIFRTTSAWAARATRAGREGGKGRSPGDTGDRHSWTFAPCIAVPRDERWGRTYEGFGETPELAETMAAAMVKGLQGEPVQPEGVLVPAPSYFVGDGGLGGARTHGGTDLSEQSCGAIHLPGYAAAVKGGCRFNHGVRSPAWNGAPWHANKHLITDVLKANLASRVS